MRSFRWGMGALGLAAAAAILLGALGLGIGAQAQEGKDGGGILHSRYLEILAGKLGIGVDELKTTMDDARTEAIDEAVASGNLTDEQAQRLKDSQSGDLRGGHFKFGIGGGPRFGVAIDDVFSAAAGVIGIDADELRSELQAGKSLAAIAEANGVAREDLIAGLRKEAESRLQTAVDDGKLTTEQQQSLLDAFDEHIEAAIDQAPLFGPMGDKGLRGFHKGPMGFDREESVP